MWCIEEFLKGSSCPNYRKQRFGDYFVLVMAVQGSQSTLKFWCVMCRLVSIAIISPVDQVFLNYSIFLGKLAHQASLLALARGSKSIEAVDINAAAPDVLKQFRI
jgi:hypothetical protein